LAPYGGVAQGDDAYALAFAIPTKTAGLKFICREAFSGGERTHFDHPLSSRFEEMDCVAIFDDVLVPWDRVLVDGAPGSGAIVNGVQQDPRAGVLIQTSARLLASLELFCGVATRLADAIGITGFLHIQEKLGQMLAQLEQVRTAFLASDAMGFADSEGYWLPHANGLAAAHLQAGAIHGQYVDIVQTLAGGGFFYAPSDADFRNPDLRPDIDKYVRGPPGRERGRPRAPVQAGLGPDRRRLRTTRPALCALLQRRSRAQHRRLLYRLRQGAALGCRGPGLRRSGSIRPAARRRAGRPGASPARRPCRKLSRGFAPAAAAQ